MTAFPRGTRILVSGFSPSEHVEWESARIGARMAYPLPLPDGYHPVKFDEDGAEVLVHRGRIRIVNGRR